MASGWSGQEAMADPRQANVEAALAAFWERAQAGRVPQRRRYGRVVGGVVGSHQWQRRKRNEQRRRAGTWRYRP